MPHEPRVVAELGRPETPDETAARKAESSRVYRSSQNTRNLVAALIATLIVLVVIIFAVPRGTPPEAAPVDVAAVAARIGDAEGRTLVAPEVPEDWRVNRAGIESDDVRAWTVVYATAEDYLNVAQGFDADPAWVARQLAGAAVDDTVTIGEVEWDRYVIDDPSRAGNISGALAAQAGSDTILIYGTADDEALEQVAEAVAPQVLELREDAR